MTATLTGVTGRMLGRFGQAVTLRHSTAAAGPNAYTQGTLTQTYTAGKGTTRGYKPEALVGGIQEHDKLFVLDAATYPVAPVPGDRLARGSFTADAGADWLQVVSANTVRVGDKTVAYRVQARK